MAFAVILFLVQLCQAASLSHIEPSADADDNPDILVISVASETWDALSAEALPSLLRGWTIVPRFQPSKLTNKHPQLRQYLEVHSSGRRQQLAALAIELADQDWIQQLFYAPKPVPPPIDIPPETPNLQLFQNHLRGEDGLGFELSDAWPIDLSYVRVANIEYGWDPSHEDLGPAPDEVAWGWNSQGYQFHGNAVLGQLIAPENGYGVRGMVPGLDVLMISPFDDGQNYNVAAAIIAAVELLVPGDVLLIEQQGAERGEFCPVEVSPDVFDAIAVAVDSGIIVVEPAGNGAVDLDDPVWEGWFDPAIQDSGAIMVGGGAPPGVDQAPRSWFFGGSSYGSRVDLQGWYTSIVTTGGAELSDAFFPESDPRQAYTANFGGTSGASPMIVAAAVIANAVSLQHHQRPWEPRTLRELLKQTGDPQPEDDPKHIGPQPNIRRLLWTWGH